MVVSFHDNKNNANHDEGYFCMKNSPSVIHACVGGQVMDVTEIKFRSIMNKIKSQK